MIVLFHLLMMYESWLKRSLGDQDTLLQYDQMKLTFQPTLIYIYVYLSYICYKFSLYK